jgi:hypothetical protein
MTDKAGTRARRALLGAARAFRHLLALVLLAELVVAATAAVQIWPAVQAAAQQGSADADPMPSVVVLGLLRGTPDPEAVFMVIVLLLGGVGASIHALMSLGDYYGNGTFLARWTWWYLFRMPLGMATALVFYLLLRGGLISAEAGTSVINPYAIAALAGLSGMFAKAASDKLEEVWKTLFRTSGGGDELRRDKVYAFRADRTEPDRMAVLTTDLAVIVHGRGFSPLTTASIGGTPRTVTYISPTVLRVDLEPVDVAQAATLALILRDETTGEMRTTPVSLVIA